VKGLLPCCQIKGGGIGACFIFRSSCIILQPMEFSTVVEGGNYQVSLLRKNVYLVTTPQKDEYIVYKAGIWKCADDLQSDLLEQLGEVIDRRITG
jgi:hypothetical protein